MALSRARARISLTIAGLVALLLAIRFGGGPLTAILGRVHGLKAATAAPINRPVVIPFELRGQLVLLPVTINGQPTLLILDSGSGASVLDSDFARSARIELSGQRVQVNGASSTAALGSARTVRVGDTQLSEMMVVVSSAVGDVQDRVGHDVHGTIGFDLFDNYVVAIDYAARTITLYPAKDFNYAGAGTVVPLSIENRIPVVTAGIVTRRSGTLNARLALDLGSTRLALKLATPFVTAHDLVHDTVGVTGPLGAEVGHVSEGQLLRMQHLVLGGLTIDRPSTGLSLDPSGAFGMSSGTDGTIGAPVWQRMRVTIDYLRSRAILEPRVPMDVPDSADASGLTLTHGGTMSTPTLRVSYVIKQSPGADAGVRVGDELVAIDGRPTSSMSMDDAIGLLRAAGSTRRLTTRRDGKTFDVPVALRIIF